MPTAAITTNPPAQASNGIGAFFGFLGQTLGTIGSAKLDDYLTIEKARTDAKVQQITNQNHALNPATGANDPAAAQRAANRTFLEKFLPPTLLYDKDPVSGVQSPSRWYYLVMAGLAVLAVLFIVRMFRR